MKLFSKNPEERWYVLSVVNGSDGFHVQNIRKFYSKSRAERFSWKLVSDSEDDILNFCTLVLNGKQLFNQIFPKGLFSDVQPEGFED
jgi:hypothetical protein